MTSESLPTNVLLQSRQAKSYLFDRCTLLGLDPFVVASHSGVSKERFTKWVNAITPEDLVNSITAQEAMGMYESIGVFPRLEFVVVPADDLNEEQKKVISEMKVTKS
jgi:hypothetical protein